MYYDIKYITPVGNPGTHSNVQADNPFDAAKISACMLSWGTQWSPMEWKITDVLEAQDKEFKPDVL